MKIGNDSWLEALTHKLYEKWEVGFEILVTTSDLRRWPTISMKKWEIGFEILVTAPDLKRWPVIFLIKVRDRLRDLSNDSWFEALTHDLFEKYIKYLKRWSLWSWSTWRWKYWSWCRSTSAIRLLSDIRINQGSQLHCSLRQWSWGYFGVVTTWSDHTKYLQMNLVISEGGWIWFIVG